MFNLYKFVFVSKSHDGKRAEIRRVNKYTGATKTFHGVKCGDGFQIITGSRGFFDNGKTVTLPVYTLLKASEIESSPATETL
jgi:hypothetical protein